MKLLLATTAAAAGLAYATGFPCSLFTCPGAASDAAEATECGPLRGQYVEGRTASVYAGACHYGGEYTTAGREAVLAWRFDEGATDGVSLAGLTVVAVVAGDENLAEAETPRESVVYLSEGATEAQREAVLAWLDPALVGTVRDVVAAPVSLERDGDRFAVHAGDRVALAGSALPNRDCCKMPFNVWYDPFDAVDEPLVGCAETFACAEDALDVSWKSSGDNCVFMGVF